jgi:hypothetical protein
MMGSDTLRLGQQRIGAWVGVGFTTPKVQDR